MSQMGRSWTGTAGKIVVETLALALAALPFTEHPPGTSPGAHGLKEPQG